VPVVTTVSMTAGECTKVWTPLSFSVLYSPGPNFPIAWGFNGMVTPDNEPFLPTCWGCPPVCEYGPMTLEFGVIVNPQFNPVAPQTFTICNVAGPGCDNLVGTISEDCADVDVDVVAYDLAPGECVEVTVSFVGGTEGYFVCEIMTGCGLVTVSGDVVVAADEGPAVFSLAEAHPNPFNPSTTIAYSVPETQDVTLSVFNTNGQLVKTLVSGMVERGAHKVVFDASSLSSGVYVYTLQTANQTAMNKMVLVK
jgi:hypothetical protein